LPFILLWFISQERNILTRLINFTTLPGARKNDEVFENANDNWHGHNYELFVTVKGEPDPDTGFLVDAKKLSIIINEHVVDKLDHMNLNLDVDFMQENV
jgi:6-pyruvoyltetrahydropterin/6-carboxytetrahydropterin synthase